MMIIKRAMDVMLTTVAIISLAPVLLVLALAVWLCLGRPVFFTQERPGLHGRPFRILKFRTMTDGWDAAGRLLPDGERLVPFGRFLRATSLDELPEFINVLKGEMSLVGPRPLLMEYLPLYSSHQARRHEVRPGLTGWAQVNGRNALTWEEKFDLDVWYVDNRSIWLDMKILWMTLVSVALREGISHAGEATMSRFSGYSGRADGHSK